MMSLTEGQRESSESDYDQNLMLGVYFSIKTSSLTQFKEISLILLVLTHVLL